MDIDTQAILNEHHRRICKLEDRFQEKKECNTEQFVTWEAFKSLEKSLMNRVWELSAYVAGTIDSRPPPAPAETEKCDLGHPNCNCKDPEMHKPSPEKCEHVKKECCGAYAGHMSQCASREDEVEQQIRRIWVSCDQDEGVKRLVELVRNEAKGR